MPFKIKIKNWFGEVPTHSPLLYPSLSFVNKIVMGIKICVTLDPTTSELVGEKRNHLEES